VANFTSAVTDLEVIGPIVDVAVAVSQAAQQSLEASGQPVPQPIPVSVMVDTGASQSVVSPAVANALGLAPVGVADVLTPTSSAVVQRPVYAVRFLLPQNLVAGVTALSAELLGQNIQGLIGRDLLKYCVLVYIGGENQFTLSF
jgi:predicted aspartyl protease